MSVPVDLSEIALNLEFDPDGFWRARTDSSISYPEEGNRMCFAVEDSSFWFRHRNHCILEILKSYPPPGAFFDIGGGNGYVARAIQDAGLDVVLVEPGLAGARNAKERGIRQIVQATLADAHFLPETLGAVGLFDVIEHIEGDGAFLDAINRVLLPNGRLYITVPAYQGFWSHEDNLAGHWRRYSLRTLTRLLIRCGYRVEFATYFFRFLLLPIFVGRVLPYRLGLTPRQAMSERMRSDHQPRNSVVAQLLEFFTRRELHTIRSGRSLPLGGSCLVVAKKN